MGKIESRRSGFSFYGPFFRIKKTFVLKNKVKFFVLKKFRIKKICFKNRVKIFVLKIGLNEFCI